MSKGIRKSLNKLLNTKKNLLELDLIKEDKYIILSDLHRGLGDTADDFKEDNQLTYAAALLHYFKAGYTLILLGDIEELEEQQNIKSVMKNHNQELQLEKLFHEKGRLIRIFGNHDDKWKKEKNVRKFLYPIFENIQVYEGILFTYDGNNQIFVVHGHQGTLISDKLGFFEFTLPVYRFFINLFNKNRKTLHSNICLVGEHEQVLYDWAIEQEKLIFICGHTHRPVWGAITEAEKLQLQIEQLTQVLKSVADTHGVPLSDVTKDPNNFGVATEVKTLREKINRVKYKLSQNGMCNVETKPKPVYFNSGCCMFTDGDITGIEIDSGNLKLIKWDHNFGGPVRQELEQDGLKSFFDKL
jgi:UDP-2,3-diacylglucosamine pyrophosphatase LpxH